MTSEGMQDLKPCPFCGDGEPQCYQSEVSDQWHVVCSMCYAKTDNLDTKRLAGNSWNTRCTNVNNPVSAMLEAKLVDAERALFLASNEPELNAMLPDVWVARWTGKVAAFRASESRAAESALALEREAGEQMRKALVTIAEHSTQLPWSECARMARAALAAARAAVEDGSVLDDRA